MEFDSHDELIHYVFNTCSASGRIEDSIELVKSQQRVHAFDYNFAFAEGTVEILKMSGTDSHSYMKCSQYLEGLKISTNSFRRGTVQGSWYGVEN